MNKVMLMMVLAGISLMNSVSVAEESGLPVVEAVHMEVNGLVCDFCAQSIKKIFGKYDTVAEVDMNLKEHYIHVGFNKADAMDDAMLTTLINDAGYALVNIKRTMAPADMEIE